MQIDAVSTNRADALTVLAACRTCTVVAVQLTLASKRFALRFASHLHTAHLHLAHVACLYMLLWYCLSFSVFFSHQTLYCYILLHGPARHVYPINVIGQVLAGVCGAQLRDVQLLHRSGLRAHHRGFPERPPWEVTTQDLPTAVAYGLLQLHNILFFFINLI